jgi:hypothetical protein
MIPNCLENFIGVKCFTPSKSGFWINDLEGLNLRYASDIADSDHISGLEFLKSKIEFATSLVLSEISSYSLPYFRINSIIDQIETGEFTTTYLPFVASDRGLKLKTKQSRLIRIRVNSIQVMIQQGNFSHSVEITDGTNVTSYPFTTDSNGFAELFPDYFSNTNELLVTMNNTAINVNDSDVKKGCGCSSKSSHYLNSNGWNGANNSNSTYGLKVKANSECSIDELGCILAPKLALPILYKSGLEIIKEAITSDRLNSMTLLDSEKTEFLFDMFSKEYDKHFKILIASIPELMKRIDDCCIICNQSRYVQGLP